MNIIKNKLILVKEQEIEYNKTIKTNLDMFEFIKDIIKLDQEPEEVLCLITLAAKNNIQSFMEVARGRANCCNVCVTDIYKRVLISNCSKFILVHNHPSGYAIPSLQDKSLTDHIKKTSKLLQLDFLDHIVIGDNEFCSCLH